MKLNTNVTIAVLVALLVVVGVSNKTINDVVVTYPGGRRQASPDEIYNIALEIWGNEADARLVLRLAQLESARMVGVRRVTSKEDSRGLMQINVFAHPWARKLNLYDPYTNLHAARRVQLSQGWTAWSTYK